MESSLKQNYITSIDDFKTLVETNKCLVDKTLFIKEFIGENSEPIQMITRPRRFGKSLNISMLRYFLDIRENSENLFKNFNVWHDKETMAHMNKYPVIYLNFKDILASSYDSFVYGVYKRILTEYEDHKCILDNLKDQYYVEKYLAFLKNAPKDTDVQDSLNALTKYLHMAYNKKVIVLIDEYDNPVHDAYGKDYSDEIIQFLKKLYGHTVKSNPHIYRALLMGILTVAKNSMFSGLNNAKVYTILNKKYKEYFGFTEDEIAPLIKREGLDMNEAKVWYNGYNFSGTTIYNPYSIMNYLEEKIADYYWVRTGKGQEDMLFEVAKKYPKIISEEFYTLISGHSINCFIHDGASLYNLDKDKKNFWSLLFHSGYLTSQVATEGMQLKLKITNNEVELLFKDIVSQFITQVSEDNLVALLFKRKKEEFKDKIEKILEKKVSYYDTGSESFIHAFIFGSAIALDADNPDYRSRSNIEAGLGRPDIIIENITIGRGMVIEIKKTKGNLSKKVKEGMAQIKDKKYYQAFDEKVKDIRLVSIAFKGKEIALDMDEITLP